MKRLFAAASLLVGLGIAPAEAAETLTTFSGTCTWTSILSFDPGLTTTQKPTTLHADASGTCSGTLKSGTSTQRLANAPTRFVLDTHSEALSCLGGPISGTATLSVGNRAIKMTIAEVQLATSSVLNLSGSSTGSAVAVATMDTRADPLSALECAGGGIAEAPITIIFTTLSPIGSAVATGTPTPSRPTSKADRNVPGTASNLTTTTVLRPVG